jgi:predicted nicotinamide N-methyase
MLTDLLDLTAGAGLAVIAEAREDVADYTATRELDPATRDRYIEHLDMLESAARILCATL